jgi:hypothetical protein
MDAIRPAGLALALRRIAPARAALPLCAATVIGLLHLSRALAQSPSQPDAGSTTALQTIVVTASRILSPGVSPSGTNDYAITSENIADMPAGDNTVLTDVLAQMPGVGIDQNQQVHIRNTEGSGFQYQIDGVLVPLDINTNPPFISMINPLFIKRFDLLDGILPAQYSYAAGGVVDIQTKDGCDQPGGSASLFAGQRGILQPSAQYAGCEGAFSYYGSALYSQSNLAFSSATPGPNPIHDWTQQGQAFGVFTYALDATTKLKLILSSAVNDNQLPNVPGLPPQFTLANAPAISSAQINSYLNFRDYLGILSLSGSPTPELSYQLSYTLHSIAELYQPDDAGELIYQGVASQATHQDLDNTLQGDLNYRIGAHKLSTGFYLGAYDVTADGNSLVFPADTNGAQTSDVPLHIINNIQSTNVLSGIYLNDLWQISPAWRSNMGVRWDDLTGFSPGNQFSPSFNLSYTPSVGTTFHGGTARYFQVPSFEGISPSAPAAFANTTGAGPPGATLPLTEHDWEWDAGIVQTLRPGLTVSEDNFFEKTWHYLDAGQFGVVPVFAPFNYDHGQIWGAELALDYNATKLSAYTNVTMGRNLEKGVATGQFNFDEPGELDYINSHYIVLDHQPLLTISTGAAYDWNHYRILVDGIFNTGLRTGFANLQSLPDVFQVNFGVRRSFQIGGHQISNQLTLWNIFDRINLIRPSGGLGVFQSAYGPRFTILDALTVSL